MQKTDFVTICRVVYEIRMLFEFANERIATHFALCFQFCVLLPISKQQQSAHPVSLDQGAWRVR